MIFSVLRSAKWLSVWRKLAPLWVGLWLLSSLGGPAAAWQHLDGTICNTCTTPAPVVDQCCETELQQSTEIAVSASHNCQTCCEPTPQRAPDKLISPTSYMAIVGDFVAFRIPTQAETRHFFTSFSLPLDALPRPPPRGRAPPFLFSI
jgi:hypothetical protein